MKRLTFQDLQGMVAGHAAALRCVTDYQPAGGPGDKVFPPTYEGDTYPSRTREALLNVTPAYSPSRAKPGRGQVGDGLGSPNV